MSHLASEEPGPSAFPLAELPAVDRADVFKGGRLAAHLERTDRGVEFSYTSRWLAEDGPPVATTLPLVSEPMVSIGGAVPAYFAGLLPEGRRLGALRRNVKTSADDELSLVLAVGADAIGDVQVVPTGTEPELSAARLQVADFAAVRFGDLLADLDVRVDRVGLPGVQDKASLAMLNLPVSAAGEKFLLKLNPPEYPNLVENEFFFLTAAAASGLEVVHAELVHDADQRPGLVVRRFDRVNVSGKVVMLAVEDGCQVLGLHPEAKYRISTEVLLGKLSSLCEAPAPAARVFVAQAVFAYLTGNGDAHAKNFSILRDTHGRWAPAPAYDLPSSQPYGDNTLALTIAGKRDGNIPGQRYVDLGRSIGLTERAARAVVHDIAVRVEEWIAGIDTLPYDRGRLGKLRKVILHRQQLLLRGY